MLDFGTNHIRASKRPRDYNVHCIWNSEQILEMVEK